MQLEEMREQIAMLKGKLENQKIVNEKQLRNSMTNKMSKIDRTMFGTVIAGLIALIYCTWFFTSLMHLSAAFTFATAALIIFLSYPKDLPLSFRQHPAYSSYRHELH